MAEPTITCPHCRNEIKLTESLAAPLVEAIRRDFEGRMASKDAEVAQREQALRAREEGLAKAKDTIDAQVAEKLGLERAKVAAEEAKKAKLALAADLDQQAKEIADLQALLGQRSAKLAAAQRAQAELIRKQRELDDAKRELDLTIEKRIQDGLEIARAQARKEAEERLHLQVAEKEQTIISMKQKLEELQRRAEQGSQQLQGEVLELELEELLKAKFPTDPITPVPKGEHGGDVLQQVMGPLGQVCGTILWESKRTKNWSDGWLAKLRADQRTAKAELSVIVSQTLPKDIETFDLVEGVWVVHPRATLPVAVALRHSLIEIAGARKAAEGQQGKMEMVYQYLTGPSFRQRVAAIVEAFSSMKEDLDREKKVITRQWAKREQQNRAGHAGDGRNVRGPAGDRGEEPEGDRGARIGGARRAHARVAFSLFGHPSRGGHPCSNQPQPKVLTSPRASPSTSSRKAWASRVTFTANPF